MSNIVVKNVKALYVMVFAPEKWEQDQVKEITKAAEGMLKGKDPNFKRLFDQQMKPSTRVDISNIQYMPFTNTPEWMQTMFTGWLKKANVEFMPMSGNNLFQHGMKDQSGKEVFFFFYFDLEEGKADVAASQKQSTVSEFREPVGTENPASKGLPKWAIIAGIAAVVILCICGAMTILPIIFFGGN